MSVSRARIESLRFRFELLLGLVRRDVLGRYRGSLFGVAWSLVSPLLLLVVYTVAFHELLGARWPGIDTRGGFAMMVFTGMVFHGLVAEVLVRAPMAVAGQPNFVKKLLFPLTVLPLVTLGSALFHAVLGLLVLALGSLATGQALHWTALLVPLVIAPYLLLLAGIAWLLSSMGVYVRDISQLGGLIATILLFLSPIFYPASVIPDKYLIVVSLNPITFVVESARGLLFDGVLPSAGAFSIYTLVALIVAATGLAVFRRLRPGFGDVL